MRLPHFFSPVDRIRCPDGRELRVYKDISKAVPFFIQGFDSTTNAKAKYAAQIESEVRREYKTAVHGLLYQLDELSGSIMLEFHGAYLVFQSDPCKHSDYLQRQVEQILTKHQQFRVLRMQIDTLISLDKQGADKSVINEMIKSLAQDFGGPIVAQAAALEVREAQAIAKEWVLKAKSLEVGEGGEDGS